MASRRSHANIVQRVKTCYKIKFNYRESKSFFMGFYSIKATLDNHPRPNSALIAPLLQSKSVTLARPIVDVLGGKTSTMTP